MLRNSSSSFDTPVSRTSTSNYSTNTTNRKCHNQKSEIHHQLANSFIHIRRCSCRTLIQFPFVGCLIISILVKHSSFNRCTTIRFVDISATWTAHLLIKYVTWVGCTNERACTTYLSSNDCSARPRSLHSLR